ncbi:hypothetical protein IE53DRAFT_92957 [Violaceomyces palustris]|uniref:Uncharacterized protein n=1 Tax=Violaceomyces palustris TaxID=1673888 RepID=A0ACD0NX98_9BASI|nr:hypothetical protein IE53DRAFT_92957 [Violaceomyces palustris]
MFVVFLCWILWRTEEGRQRSSVPLTSLRLSPSLSLHHRSCDLVREGSEETCSRLRKGGFPSTVVRRRRSSSRAPHGSLAGAMQERSRGVELSARLRTGYSVGVREGEKRARAFPFFPSPPLPIRPFLDRTGSNVLKSYDGMIPGFKLDLIGEVGVVLHSARVQESLPGGSHAIYSDPPEQGSLLRMRPNLDIPYLFLTSGFEISGEGGLKAGSSSKRVRFLSRSVPFLSYRFLPLVFYGSFLMLFMQELGFVSAELSPSRLPFVTGWEATIRTVFRSIGMVTMDE